MSLTNMLINCSHTLNSSMDELVICSISCLMPSGRASAARHCRGRGSCLICGIAISWRSKLLLPLGRSCREVSEEEFSFVFSSSIQSAWVASMWRSGIILEYWVENISYYTRVHEAIAAYICRVAPSPLYRATISYSEWGSTAHAYNDTWVLGVNTARDAEGFVVRIWTYLSSSCGATNERWFSEGDYR